MKHVIVFVLLVLGIFLLATRKSNLDVLMTPVARHAEVQAGDRFVEVAPSRFPITPKELAEPGMITIVYFHDETCPGCIKLDRDLADFRQVRPDVAVRKVRITLNGDAYYEAIKNYQWEIYAAPFILIFGKDGKLIAADEKTNFAGQDLLEEWIGEELSKAAKRS